MQTMDSIQNFVAKYAPANTKECERDLMALISNSTQVKEKRDEFVKLFEELTKNMTEKKMPTSNALGPFASKTAKDYAEEKGIDPDNVTGTGKNGKITKKDLESLTGESKKPEPKSKGKGSGKAKGKTGGKVDNKNSKNTKKSDTEKHPCSGTTSKGDPCKKSGKTEINGDWYCATHQKGKIVEVKDEDAEDSVDVDDPELAELENSSVVDDS